MEERIRWSSEWNTERVREEASDDSEDGEDDELSCVIGESAGGYRGYREYNCIMLNDRERPLSIYQLFGVVAYVIDCLFVAKIRHFKCH